MHVCCLHLTINCTVLYSIDAKWCNHSCRPNTIIIGFNGIYHDDMSQFDCTYDGKTRYHQQHLRTQASYLLTYLLTYLYQLTQTNAVIKKTWQTYMKNMQEAHKCFVYVNLPHHQCRSQGGGALVHAPPRPVVVRVKFLRAVDLDLLLLAMTLYWILVCRLLTKTITVYRRSVSFPCVVYFCLFSSLKDRCAFSICLQLLGLRPHTSTGVLPLDPAGGLSSPRSLFCPPPLANFWLRHCTADC